MDKSEKPANDGWSGTSIRLGRPDAVPKTTRPRARDLGDVAVETFVRFVPGQCALWKITTDHEGNEVLLIRDGAELTPFLLKMIRDLAVRRGLVCDMATALQQWNSSAVPRPRRETGTHGRRIHQLRGEDTLRLDLSKKPVAERESLSECE